MPFQNRVMTLVAFLQAQNCSNLPGSWRRPSTMPDFLAPPAEAANFGHGKHMEHDARYDRADEFMEVVLGTGTPGKTMR